MGNLTAISKSYVGGTQTFKYGFSFSRILLALLPAGAAAALTESFSLLSSAGTIPFAF